MWMWRNTGGELEGKEWLVNLAVQGREEQCRGRVWAVDKIGRRDAEAYTSVVLVESDGEIWEGSFVKSRFGS